MSGLLIINKVINWEMKIVLNVCMYVKEGFINSDHITTILLQLLYVK